MRRTDREIKDFDQIIDVLDRCETIRIGLHGDPWPYVVPVSFGYEVENRKVIIYFHGARQGLKHDLIKRNNHVCVEADKFYSYTGQGAHMSAFYESFIGFGTVEPVEGDEAVKGLRLLMRHCGGDEDAAASCASAGATGVYKITLESITGKRHMPL